MKFIPYPDLKDTPNIIVDGAGNDHTLLTLSHWPQSGTPAHLRADLSAQIVFKYLDQPNKITAPVVSNDHFDEDGLVGLYILLHPNVAITQRDQLVDIASAGDFGAFKNRDSARVSFVISAFADKEFSPLSKAIFDLSYPHYVGELYQALLPKLPGFINNLEHYKPLWEQQDAWLTQSQKLINDNKITIEEYPALDLAIVRIPDSLHHGQTHRFSQNQAAICHPFAIHNATDCFRLILIQGEHYEFQYRYESWVQYQTRKPLPRVDLSALADTLTKLETNNSWQFDGVDAITPKLSLVNDNGSSINQETFISMTTAILKNNPPSWDPYDK